MGKQSARILYQGEDHCDVVFMDKNGYPHNHSKIYKGSNLLWKREKPKYLFLYSDNTSNDRMSSTVCTSDALQTLSAFVRCPDNMRYAGTVEDPSAPFGAFIDVEYIFDKYFAILRVGTRINSGSVFDNKYSLCCSDDGYEWKKIKSIALDNDNVPIILKRYVYGENEVLVIVNRHNIMFMDSGYDLRTVFNLPEPFPDYAASRDSTTTRSKNGVLIISNLRMAYCIVARGESFTVVKDFSYYTLISNASKSGVFYGMSRDGEVLRSTNGIEWSLVKKIRVFPNNRYNGSVETSLISVIDDYLYILSIYEEEDSTVYAGRHPYIIRINLQTGVSEEKLIESNLGLNIRHYIVIDNTIFLKTTENNTIYYMNWKDVFNEEREESTRITCQFNSPGAFTFLYNVVSSDYDVDITV